MILAVQTETTLPTADNASTRLSPGQDLKRTGDVVVALLMAPVAAVIILVAAILIVVSDRHLPFYVDSRIGSGGRKFGCYKLRTMYTTPGILARYLAAHPDEADRYHRTRKLSRDPRVTPLGMWLRRLSIDELPQLLNVLRGDMSFVGPRPLSEGEYLARGRRRHALTTVRPGLTGLWQISGRSTVPLRARAAMDYYYVVRWSLRLDLVILLLTPVAILRGRGAI